jgi:hypothetical protein
METPESTTSKYGKRYSQAEKDDILGRYRASGLKLDTFARQAGIGPWTVKRWLGGERTVRRPKLVAIRVVRSQQPEEKGSFEVVFTCGTTLRVDQAALAQVVNVLRRPC